MEKAAEVLQKSFARNRNPAVKLLGGKIVSAVGSGGIPTLVMTFQANTCFQDEGGSVSPGVASAMLDAVCANAVVAHTELDKTVATLEQKCSFLAPVPVQEEVFATAKIMRVGKDFAFLEAELRDSENNLLVRSTQSNSLLNLPRREEKKNRESRL